MSIAGWTDGNGVRRIQIDYDDTNGELIGATIDARGWREGIAVDIEHDGATRTLRVSAGQHRSVRLPVSQRIALTRDLSAPKLRDRNWKMPEGTVVRFRGDG